MIIELREPSSGNLMTQTGSLELRPKTYHDFIYTEKMSFFLDVLVARGFYKRRSHERNILCKTIS